METQKKNMKIKPMYVAMLVLSLAFIISIPVIFVIDMYGLNNKPKVYSDIQIKRISYEQTLNKKQIFNLLNRPISVSINKYHKYFSCSKNDLKFVMVAITCLETGNLKSNSIHVNNFVGMKKIKNRPSFNFKTTEYVDGELIKCEQSFTSFYSVEDCYMNFLDLLIRKERYSEVLKAKSPKSFLVELSKAGYATDPKYFDKVYKILNDIKN